MTDILQLERDSIRAFVADNKKHLAYGRVIDIGCGQQPYRDLVDGDYYPYDDVSFPANVSGENHGSFRDWESHRFDAALCTQVIQYVVEPVEFLRSVRDTLKPLGKLVITGPTNWRVIEPDDKWRFTMAGIAELLDEASFTVSVLQERATVTVAPGHEFSLGWGAVSVAPPW